MDTSWYDVTSCGHILVWRQMLCHFNYLSGCCRVSCLLGCQNATDTIWPWRPQLKSPSKHLTAQHPPTLPPQSRTIQTPKALPSLLQLFNKFRTSPIACSHRTRPTVIQSNPHPINPLTYCCDHRSWNDIIQVPIHKIINNFSTIPCILHSPPIIPSVFSPPKLHLASSGRSRDPVIVKFFFLIFPQAPKNLTGNIITETRSVVWGLQV